MHDVCRERIYYFSRTAARGRTISITGCCYVLLIAPAGNGHGPTHAPRCVVACARSPETAHRRLVRVASPVARRGVGPVCLVAAARTSVITTHTLSRAIARLSSAERRVSSVSPQTRRARRGTPVARLPADAPGPAPRPTRACRSLSLSRSRKLISKINLA
jgi:hypothetical protein